MATDKRESRPVHGAMFALLLVVVLVAVYFGAYLLLLNGIAHTYAGGKLVAVSGTYQWHTKSMPPVRP